MEFKPLFKGHTPPDYFKRKKELPIILEIMLDRAIKAACKKEKVEEGDNQ